MDQQGQDALQQRLDFTALPLAGAADTAWALESTDLEPDGMLEQRCFTVSELTAYLQALMEEDPVLGGAILVQGELSNVNQSSRGHVYFTLKDAESAVKGVIWAGMARHLPFDLEDGMAVYVTGQLEIYAPSGTYSLITRKIEPMGVGALQLAFEQIKARLDAQGYFLPEFKKPIPPYAMRVGIVTSRTGAVIHDMLRVIRRKNPLVDVLLAPVTVQGPGAAEEIAAAITELCDPRHSLDVLIVARGGGSFEDLFCFSEEPVIKAVFHAPIPIITGIGHEPDFSLADAAADDSASTPTAAAERAVWELEAMRQQLAQYRYTLIESLHGRLMRLEQQFDQTVTAVIHTYQTTLNQAAHAVDNRQHQLLSHIQHTLQGLEQRLTQYAAELEAFSPLATMGRGYAMATTPQGRVIRSAKAIQVGQQLNLRFYDGQLHCEVIDYDPAR